MCTFEIARKGHIAKKKKKTKSPKAMEEQGGHLSVRLGVDRGAQGTNYLDVAR